MNPRTIPILPLRISPRVTLHSGVGNSKPPPNVWLGDRRMQARERPYQVFVDDPAVYARAYAAWTQHYRGYPDEALATVRDCMQVARMQSHPRTMAMATIFAGHLLLFRREPDAAIEHCRTANSLAASMGFPLPGFCSRYWRVALRSSVERETRGVEAIKRGFDPWQSLGSGLGSVVPWRIRGRVEFDWAVR